MWISASALLFMSVTQSAEAQIKSNGLDDTRAVEKKSKHAPQLTEYELMWKTIETHGKVEFQIGGKKIKLKKRFDVGEEPYFNAFEQGLEPGVYTYKIKFIPNQLQKDRDSFRGAVNQRKELLKLRNKKLEQGDRDAAKELLQQANKLRNSAAQQMLNMQRHNDYDFITKTGRIIVDKDGAIKEFDEKKLLQEAARRDKEEKRTKALEREEEDLGTDT